MVTIVTDGRSTLKWLWKGLNRSWLDALGVGFIRENNRKWDCRLRFKQATCPLRARPFQDPHNLATRNWFIFANLTNRSITSYTYWHPYVSFTIISTTLRYKWQYSQYSGGAWIDRIVKVYPPTTRAYFSIQYCPLCTVLMNHEKTCRIAHALCAVWMKNVQNSMWKYAIVEFERSTLSARVQSIKANGMRKILDKLKLFFCVW